MNDQTKRFVSASAVSLLLALVPLTSNASLIIFSSGNQLNQLGSQPFAVDATGWENLVFEMTAQPSAAVVGDPARIRVRILSGGANNFISPTPVGALTSFGPLSLASYDDSAFDVQVRVSPPSGVNELNYSFLVSGDRIGSVAVPEPGTLGLLGAGLVGIGAMCRRRRAQAG